MRKIFYKKKKNREITKGKYIRLELEFLALFALFLGLLYYNYDYMFFKILISKNYIYTDALEQLYSERLGIDEENYTKYFDDLTIALVTDKLYEKSADPYTYLSTDEEHTEYEEYFDDTGKKSYAKELSAEAVYFRLTNFSENSRKIFAESVKDIKDYNYFILDLRDNTGGSLSCAYKIADLFLDKDAVIANVYTRSPLFSACVTAKNSKKLDYKKIFILQNENTASSSEVLINALAENLDNVTTVGAKSFGKGIGQAEFMLKHGFYIKATTLRLETPLNNSIHKTGIEPDIKYDRSDVTDLLQDMIASGEI